ncbi:MAG: hypothetical protein NT120_01485 [Candidatus Aenigmarchaeota archaeon]|nr:hypothetical protein [Candidatus Aenigmarchaeota archaeon]
MEEEEYELVPLNPLRKMEKRLDRLEKSGIPSQAAGELVDVVKTNQRVVDDMVKTNAELMTKITELTNTVNQMITKMDEFLNRLEVGGTEGQEVQEAPAVNNDVEKRMERMEKRINAVLVSTLAKSRAKQIARPMQR